MDLQQMHQLAIQLKEQRQKEKEAALQRKQQERRQQYQQRTKEQEQKFRAKFPEGTHSKFQLGDARLFKDLMRVATLPLGTTKPGYGDYVTIYAGKDGLAMRKMDPSHIYLVEFNAPPTQFLDYAYEGEKEIPLAFEGLDVLAMLKTVRDDDVVTCLINGQRKDGGNVAELTFGNREYTMDLYEDTSSMAPLPKVELAARLQVGKQELIKELQSYAVSGAEQITIEAKGDRVTFGSKTDKSTASSYYDASAHWYKELSVDKRQRATYNTDFLIGFLRRITSVETVDVEWSSKKPIRVSGTYEKTSFAFWLAPRISGDNEEMDEGPKPPTTPEPTNQGTS